MATWLKTFVFALLLVVGPKVTTAADVAVATFATETAAMTSEAALKSYLDRKAVLLLLRARFDVISMEDVAPMLATEAVTFAASGPSDEAIASLDSDLEAEGLYAIVQLRYLIQSGGSLWPSDKAEDTYVNDALDALRQMQLELPELLTVGEDPLPLFVRIDQINAWTEGFAEVPPEFDHFSTRDELVTAALAETAPVSL